MRPDELEKQLRQRLDALGPAPRRALHALRLSAGFARIADSVGLGDVRLHDVRHGFSVAPLRAGVNVKVVAEALGHSRASFTLDVYMHVLPGMGEQVASAIETALAASSAATGSSE